MIVPAPVNFKISPKPWSISLANDVTTDVSYQSDFVNAAKKDLAMGLQGINRIRYRNGFGRGVRGLGDTIADLGIEFGKFNKWCWDHDGEGADFMSAMNGKYKCVNDIGTSGYYNDGVSSPILVTSPVRVPTPMPITIDPISIYSPPNPGIFNDVPPISVSQPPTNIYSTQPYLLNSPISTTTNPDLNSVIFTSSGNASSQVINPSNPSTVVTTVVPSGSISQQVAPPPNTDPVFDINMNNGVSPSGIDSRISPGGILSTSTPTSFLDSITKLIPTSVTNLFSTPVATSTNPNGSTAIVPSFNLSSLLTPTNLFIGGGIIIALMMMFSSNSGHRR